MRLPWSRLPAYLVILFLTATLTCVVGFILLFLQYQDRPGRPTSSRVEPRTRTAQALSPLDQLHEVGALHHSKPARSLPFLKRYGFRWATNEFWFLREMSARVQEEIYFLPDERVFAFYREGDRLQGKLGPGGYREGEATMEGFSEPMEPLWYLDSPAGDRDATFWLHTDSYFALVNLSARTVQLHDGDDVLHIADFEQWSAEGPAGSSSPYGQVLATARAFQVRTMSRGMSNEQSVRGTFPDSFSARPTRVRISTHGETIAFAIPRDSSHVTWLIYNHLGLLQESIHETTTRTTSAPVTPAPSTGASLWSIVGWYAFLPCPLPIAAIVYGYLSATGTVVHGMNGELPPSLQLVLALLTLGHLAGGGAGWLAARLCARARPHAVGWGGAGIVVGVPILALMAYDLAKSEGIPCPRCRRLRRSPPECSHCGHVESLAVPLIGVSRTQA